MENILILLFTWFFKAILYIAKTGFYLITNTNILLSLILFFTGYLLVHYIPKFFNNHNNFIVKIISLSGTILCLIFLISLLFSFAEIIMHALENVINLCARIIYP